MQPVTVEELINYKILPFDIFTTGDKLLFPAGEVLTPGKFLQLRHIEVIYRHKEKNDKSVEKNTTSAPTPDINYTEKYNVPVMPSNVYSMDNIDVKNIRMPVNKQSKIPAQEQIKLKVFYDQTVSDMEQASTTEALTKFKDIRNKILQEYSNLIESAVYSSQLRLLGEYDKCHAINVAILTSALARKLGKSDEFVSDITLAALIHDLGKLCLPKTLIYQPGMTNQEQKLYQAHTKIGYNLIKNKLGLNEKIARVALEHHEKNDGTGYPHGKSGDFISVESQIISVCNYFDNLTSNKTHLKVNNSKEALKVMLEMGSKNFAIDILYTFIYMFNYDDTMPFDEMTIL